MLKKNISIKLRTANLMLSLIPFSLLHGVYDKKILIGFYHLVSNEEIPHIKHLYNYKNTSQFKNDLDFVLREFTPISLNEFLKFIKNEQNLPKNALLLTFDDGLRQIYDIVLPILLDKGVPATFFISSDFIDNKKLARDHKASLIIEYLKRQNNLFNKIKAKNILNSYGHTLINEDDILNLQYKNELILNEIAYSISLDYQGYLLEKKPYLTSNQINDMIKKGFSIGAHSIDHPLYSTLSLEQQLFQTISSMSFIRNKFDLDYGAFAFPHNSYGVSNDFYTLIKKTGLVDVFFGTSGIMLENNNYLFQRFDMEMPLQVQKIISFYYARSTYKKYQLWINSIR